ncbi:hypothetical protein EVA_08790 [gut metagenome]|uniref:Uncharacterized protein n=1 Tax=gut metagenome TaxID=749906 RepID=J9G8D1_9ZZZZ
MSKFLFYAVPEAIVRELGLTGLRRDDAKGHWLLSAGDLRPYGIDKALSEGARTVTAEEVKEMFNPKTFQV